MQTVAYMREYINEYVRRHSIQETGVSLLQNHFGIPYSYIETQFGDEFHINHIPMSYDEAKDYIKDFFENLDTTSVLELYNKIKT